MVLAAMYAWFLRTNNHGSDRHSCQVKYYSTYMHEYVYYIASLGPYQALQHIDE